MLLVAPLLATTLSAQSRRPAMASDTWADEAAAQIRPGAQTMTGAAKALCTAGFLFFDDQSFYVSQAAHCASVSGPTASNGCATESLPLGTEVWIGNDQRLGHLAYSSWLTMQAAGEADEDLCAYNDFALVRVDGPRSIANPTVPVWGGPDRLLDGELEPGAGLHSYGNSPVWLGQPAACARVGILVGRTPSDLAFRVLSVPPGVPGDSGGPYLDESGAAAGILSSLQYLPYPGANRVTALGAAVDYMSEIGGLRAQLATGTRPFASTRTDSAEC